MPLLSKSINLYPEDLLDHPANGFVAGKKWMVIKTRPRQEKRFMQKIHQRNISFYTPIIEHIYRSPNGRLRTSFLPLFSSYVFVYGTDEDRFNSLTTDCVLQVLNVEDQVTLQNDLRTLERVIREGVGVTLETKLDVGDRVRILSGAFKDTIGQVVVRKGVKRLLVSIDFLQQGASVEFYDWEMEKY